MASQFGEKLDPSINFDPDFTRVASADTRKDSSTKEERGFVIVTRELRKRCSLIVHRPDALKTRVTVRVDVSTDKIKTKIQN